MATAWTCWGAVACSCLCACAWPETHYVSLDGSDQAPYLTPQTAARSIQSAVDVASPGDTVSVAPGEYDGAVLMGPGLMLLGSGADRTRIVGGIEAGTGTEIRHLALTQEAVQGEAGYASEGIKGPVTGALTVVGCSISGTYQSGILCRMDAGYAVIQDCQIRGMRTPPLGQGVAVWQPWGARPLVCLVDGCVLEDNNTGLEAASSGGVWVMRTRFSGNGTAAYIWDTAEILGCHVEGNLYGVSVDGSAHVVIESSALTRNAEHGLWCGDCTEARLTNCTITGNRSGVELAYVEGVEARSCIIWGNDVDVDNHAPLSPLEFEARYSDLGAAPDYEYVHDEGVQYDNIDADPLFVDAGGGNYRLRPQSPCIDTGSGKNYDAILLRTAYDLDGKRRFVYGGKDCEVDMGAYEYHINRLTPGPAVDQVMLTWSCYYRSEYSIFYSEDLVTWHLADGVPSAGSMTTSWIDDGSLTGVPPSLAPRRFYRILENP